jgi:hypothetical protein
MTKTLPGQDGAMMIATWPPATLDSVLPKALCALGTHNLNKENDMKNCIGRIRNGVADRAVLCGLLLTVLLGAANMASAQATIDLKFRGGIGVIPVTGVSVTGVGTLNVVRGVNPAGPWRIADLKADVSSDGNILVKGRGLLLAAGNGIGTNVGASVFATLFCGAAAPAAFNSTRVALERDGDFRIQGLLSPLPPVNCEAPVLLIRNAAGSGVWFAAGIPDLE